MQTLHEWFFLNQRGFPWRSEITPYRVWISEIMLQQTRASVVVSYFLRWMEQFPNVETLAAAPLEKVIKAWEGLGYYSRVRNLHAAARQIVSEYGGKIPSSREALSQLKGVGPYTVGAILSFGFHQRAAAVDGNVIRVLSRYFAVEENVDRPRVRKKIEELGEKILDEKEPWVTAEALIELGASVCIPNRPRCDECPLQQQCLSFRSGKAQYLPIKNQKSAITYLCRIVTVIKAGGKILLKKGEAGKVMADLYEFPYFEKNEPLPWGLNLSESVELKPIEHTFTRFKARLYPHLFHFSATWEIKGHEWIEVRKIESLPFSSGHRKIVQNICKSYI